MYKRAFGLCFVFGKGFYVQLPVNAVLPLVVASNGNTRLTGSLLFIARAVWLLRVIPSLGFCIASIIASYQQMQTVCVDLTACNNIAGAIPPQALQTLHSFGISASEFAVLLTIFNVITAAIW